jgi:hypothetical protein
MILWKCRTPTSFTHQKQWREPHTNLKIGKAQAVEWCESLRSNSIGVGRFLHLSMSRHKITPLSTEGYLQIWGALQIYLKFSPSLRGGHLKISVNIILDDATFMSKVPCAMLSSQTESLPSIFKGTKFSSFSCEVKEFGMSLFWEFVSHALS